MNEQAAKTAEQPSISERILDYIDAERGRPVPVRDLIEEFEEVASERDIRKAAIHLAKQGLVQRAGKDTYRGKVRDLSPKSPGLLSAWEREFAPQIFENAEDWLASYVRRKNQMRADQVTAALDQLGWHVSEDETKTILARLRAQKAVKVNKNGYLQWKGCYEFNKELYPAQCWLVELFAKSEEALDIEDIVLNFYEVETEVVFSVRAVREVFIALLKQKRLYAVSGGWRFLTDEQQEQRRAAREALSRKQARVAGVSKEHLTDIVLDVLRDAKRNMSIAEVTATMVERGCETNQDTVRGTLTHLFSKGRVLRKTHGLYSHPTFHGEAELSRQPLTEAIECILREKDCIMSIDEITDEAILRGIDASRLSVGGALVHLTGHGRALRKADGKYAHPNLHEDAPLSDLPLVQVIEHILRERKCIMTVDEVTAAAKALGVKTNRGSVAGGLVHLANSERIARKAPGKYAPPGVTETLSPEDITLNDLVVEILRDARRVMKTDEVLASVRKRKPGTPKCSVSATLVRLVDGERLVRLGAGLYADPNANAEASVNERAMTVVILEVLSEAGKPMSNTEVMERLREKGFDKPKQSVMGTITYLTRKGDIIRTSRGVHVHPSAADKS